MRAMTVTMRNQGIALMGVVERNSYLVKRYGWWELAFFLGIVFEILTETVAWERWEGTIEYTVMAPLPRAVHLLGMGVFAVLYGVLRTAALFLVVALFFGLSFPDADFGAALLLLAVASVSFVGVGMVTAVLPLISPEKGAQLGFIAQGMVLVVSGVYYPVEVMPGWMQAAATVSPATYALHGIRDAVLDGAGAGAVWGDVWPLLVLGAVAIPLGLAIFRAGERYAKRHGKLKRAGEGDGVSVRQGGVLER